MSKITYVSTLTPSQETKVAKRLPKKLPKSCKKLPKSDTKGKIKSIHRISLSAEVQEPAPPFAPRRAVVPRSPLTPKDHFSHSPLFLGGMVFGLNTYAVGN
jgi:hypothetical protein